MLRVLLKGFKDIEENIFTRRFNKCLVVRVSVHSPRSTVHGRAELFY
jgi:hypothetical protein